MPILNPRLNFVDKFLEHFSPLFTKKQMNLFKAYVYGMFSDYKRLSLAAIANNTTLNYQKLQYFFSESRWDIRELNDIRVKLLQNQRTTKAFKGVLAIDDTACPKPYAEKTEGAQHQYCAPLDKQENCNIAVASCFVSNTKRFPVNFKSYIPMDTTKPQSFKSKLELAKDLIDDALTKGMVFSSVVVDSWYASSDMIEFAASRNLSFVSEVKINRSMFFTHPRTKQWLYMRADEIIPFLKEYYPHKMKYISIPKENGEDRNVLTYSFDTKLKDCKTKIKVVFMFDKWSEHDDKNTHALITTDLLMSEKTVLTTYLLRWGIEESFRELKDSFCFDQYQVRHQEQIQRHWIMSFLAWSLTYWIKQNGCLSKILEEPPQTISECKRAVASLIIIDSAFLLSKNKEFAASLYKIKSERFKKRLKN